MDTDTAPAAPVFDPDDLAAAIVRSTRARLCMPCALDGPGDAAYAAAPFGASVILLVDADECDARHTH
jgi:hypothetical protein